jgi:endonuclease-3
MPNPKSKNAAPAKKPDAGPALRRAPARRRSAYNRAEVEEIFRRFSVQRPDPRSELEYVNPFTLLVAVVLSAQATDASVNKATAALFEIADTPETMAALGEERLGRYIRTIGLWRAKAKNVIALSKALVAEHGGKVPASREALMKLPGVGRKTANVVLNTAFGQDTLAVDTHIFRLGNRLRLAPGDTPDEVEQGLIRIIPPHYLRHAHHWLILHGRYVCKARRPECERCIIADLCRYPDKTNSVPVPVVPVEPLAVAAQ